MNRYSLIFALLVASSFAVHPTQAGNGASPEGDGSTSAASNASAGGAKPRPAKAKPGARQSVNSQEGPLSQEAVTFIQGFVGKAGAGAEPAKSLQILFATVPHPVETHLASAFDHNLEALQDGLQEAGYTFDSAWIPWSVHRGRGDFDDDEKEKKAREEEDDTPGILLFRSQNTKKDAYAEGIVVFLITEKPTEGIAISQARQAVEILQRSQIAFSGQIRILGPTYSGSFASLVPMVEFLSSRNPTASILIRSGVATGGDEAARAVVGLAKRLPGVGINFGSAHHEYQDWIRPVSETLQRIGIDRSQSVVLGEDESYFGGIYGLYNGPGYKKDPRSAGMWSLNFPRDISSLRAGYQKQGIFDAPASAQTWKRFLNLKSDDQNVGDTIPAFGGTTTTTTQEAVLFGISQFLKTHNIRAVIISATNEEDRLFLTQFLHANNPGVRVVVIGATRIFMRGSMAQFRGDMMVDDFPMLPRLHDWTGEIDDLATRIFADDAAQGTFFAAVDLFPGRRMKWYPEYSEPDWAAKGESVQRPPMYVVALGSNSTWPVSEMMGFPWGLGDTGGSRVEFPFTLFEHGGKAKSETAPSSQQLHVGRYWKILFVLVALLIFLYCACIWYANRVSHDQFASFQPSPSWEFWLLKVTVPALVAGCAFWVMAWAVAMPASASSNAVLWWWAAEWATFLAPLAIAITAAMKALFWVRLEWNPALRVSFKPKWLVRIEVSRDRRILVSFLQKFRVHVEFRWIGWAAVSFLAVLFILIAASFIRIWVTGPVAGGDVGAILNTYREMHWESGLSLIPTGLFFLLAILVWASQAGNGASVLKGALPLPTFPGNARISQERAMVIRSLGRPLPNFPSAASLWIVWSVPVAVIGYAHFHFRPLVEITTLESSGTTSLVRVAAAALVTLILFDVLQFLWLWDGLRGLLRALDRERFKRSFVAIDGFDWRSLWSFTGVSLQSRRAINAALIDCLLDLASKHGFTALGPSATALEEKRKKYNTVDLDAISVDEYAGDRQALFDDLATAGDGLAVWMEDPQNAGKPEEIPPEVDAIQRALACQCKGDGGRFSDEAEELARLPEKQQAVERFLCLMYIGFIQTVVARLHTLLFSVASMFSLATLGIAIYPFVPFSSLLVSGIALVALIAWAFFKVFSQMDTDPILSRIVNGDDRKLQGSFYFKFAEAMALPLLTLGSSILPGGAGRLLELAQSLFNHAQ